MALHSNTTEGSGAKEPTAVANQEQLDEVVVVLTPGSHLVSGPWSCTLAEGSLSARRERQARCRSFQRDAGTLEAGRRPLLRSSQQ